MAENPLLPDAELRRLYHLLKLASRTPARSACKDRPAAAELLPSGVAAALTTACTMQLRSEDALLVSSVFYRSPSLVKIWHDAGVRVPQLPTGISPLLTGASLASVRRGSDAEPIALALVETDQPDPTWKPALRWAQEQCLPFVAALLDRSGPTAMQPGRSNASIPGWKAVHQLCQELQLPVLTVDGTDAVATYRVMQESALRARAGGGPAVLWAVLPLPDTDGTAPPPSSTDQLARYMKVRRIPLR